MKKDIKKKDGVIAIVFRNLICRYSFQGNSRGMRLFVAFVRCDLTKVKIVS